MVVEVFIRPQTQISSCSTKKITKSVLFNQKCTSPQLLVDIFENFM